MGGSGYAEAACHKKSGEIQSCEQALQKTSKRESVAGRPDVMKGGEQKCGQQGGRNNYPIRINKSAAKGNNKDSENKYPKDKLFVNYGGAI
jgi:hypothetical protein